MAFLSNYLEANGLTQIVASKGNIAFDANPENIDIVGSGITVDPTGRVFTITKPGLYDVEWSVNLHPGSTDALICMLENGEADSPMSCPVAGGNCSSGALINVTSADIPYTISLHNFGGEIIIEEPDAYEGSAASIRILRFAEGSD